MELMKFPCGISIYKQVYLLSIYPSKFITYPQVMNSLYLHSSNVRARSAWYSLLLCGYWRSGLIASQGFDTKSTLQESNPKPLDLVSSALTTYAFRLVFITAGWPEAVWIKCLPKAFTRDHRCGNRTPDLLILFNIK